MPTMQIDCMSMNDGRVADADSRRLPYPKGDATKFTKEVADVSPDWGDCIIQMGLGFQASKVLLSAVELDLFTELAARPLDGEALRRRLGLNERAARDFFDTLVALGHLERQDGFYRNTRESDFYLDRNKPSYVGGVLHHASKRSYLNWGSLTEALRTGKPQNGVKDGEDLFDSLYADPASLTMFAQAMTGLSLPAAKALTERFRWAEHRTFIDIGTAEGGVPLEIARAHPHLTGGGFDLPKMRSLFEAQMRRHGLEGRLQFHSGDFLEGPLPAADVLLMGHILHDWNLEVKLMLLAKAHAALSKGGVLIVYDQMIDDERRENAAGLLMSLNMLVHTRGGFDYTSAECIGWMHKAGFAAIHCENLSGPYSMVVGTK